MKPFSPREPRLDFHASIHWSSPSLQGSPPHARGGHSALLVNKQILVFGGQYFSAEGAFVYLNDLHCLDLTTSTWQLRRMRSTPAPRYFHAATILSKPHAPLQMYIFGGKGESDLIYRDMHYCEKDEWYHVSFTGASPSARFGHSLCAVNASQLIVFGGWDGKKSMNDTWIFDTVTSMWECIQSTGNRPSPRHNHSAVAVAGSKTLLVYGGCTVMDDALPMYHKDLYVFQYETHVWSRPRTQGYFPIGTFGQSVCLIPNEAEELLLFTFGGWSGTDKHSISMGDKNKKTRDQENLEQPSRTLCVLHVQSMEWHSVTSHGMAVSNRYGHSCTVVGPYIFLLGGWDGNAALSQVVVGELSL